MATNIIAQMAQFQTGTVKTTYKIERMMDRGYATVYETDDHVEAEREYESLRNEFTDGLYRLVAVIQHVERVGQGRVYD